MSARASDATTGRQRHVASLQQQAAPHLWTSRGFGRAVRARCVAMTGTTASQRQARRAALADLVEHQAGVVHRRQLAQRGWTSAQVRAELAAERWRRGGDMTVLTHTGPLTTRTAWWRAVLEVGPTAVLAGATALQSAGLQGVDDRAVHVAAPKSARPRRVPGVVVHETRRLRPADVVPVGIPRMRVAVAAVLAALWAVSDRQAAMFLLTPVQQRLTTPAGLADAAARVRRHGRRTMLTAVINDLADGVQALSELDFAALCRQAGLPDPSRQRVVLRPGDRAVLDVEWDEWQVAAEIDGVHHMEVATWLADAWRHNDVVTDGRMLLRFPHLAVRLEPDRVVGQVAAALMSRGWVPDSGRQWRRPA